MLIAYNMGKIPGVWVGLIQCLRNLVYVGGQHGAAMFHNHIKLGSLLFVVIVLFFLSHNAS